MRSSSDQVAAFLSAIFDPRELVCPGRTVFDTEFYPVDYVKEIAELQRFNFVAVNPFSATGTRNDASVSVFRSFLVEFDTLSLEEQVYQVEDELHLPFTTKTFSGSKSVHYVLSLEEPLPNVEAYRDVVGKLHDILRGADTKCKNPSRFTRMAGIDRDDTGLPQELLEVRPRVTQRELLAFFSAHSDKLFAADKKRKEILAKQNLLQPGIDVSEDFRGRLTLRTKNFIKDGALRGGRNAELHFCACDFRNNLFTIEEAFEQLLPRALASGLSEFEAALTIRSAYKTAPIRPRL
jgi:hypothetical protein